jgi:tight adherence protein C
MYPASTSLDRSRAMSAGLTAGVLVLIAARVLRPRPARIAYASTRPVACNQAARVRRARGLGWVIATIAALTLGPIAAMCGVAGVVVTTRWRRARQRRQVERHVRQALPDFVDLLVLTVRAGRSPASALGAITASVHPVIAEALRAVDVRTRRGDLLGEALVELSQRLGPGAQPIADALALASRYGTPLVPVLDRLAAEARAERRRQAEAAARQLPITLSFPLVGCTLPSFVLLTVVPLLAGTVSSLRGLPR